MSFELINVSTNFQIYINKIFHVFFDLFVLMYFDDIFIYTKKDRKYFEKKNFLQKHINQIKQILEKLIQHELYCKFSKCKFHENSVNFLKFIFFFTNISMQKNRMFIVRD